MPRRRSPCCPVCGCIGVCYPVNDQGGLDSVCWEITAPSCSNIDGETGVFTPVDPQFQTSGPCGHCTCYINITDSFLLPGSFWVPVGFCMESPCSVRICFALSADRNESYIAGTGTAVEACCSRLKLLVGIDQADAELGTGIDDIDSNCGAEIAPTYCTDLARWREIGLSSCSCGDLATGVVGLYSLADLAIICNGTISGGVCNGFPDCCGLLSTCDLSDATLSIAVCPSGSGTGT